MAFFDRFQGFLTLGDDINKVDTQKQPQEEGIVSKLVPELTLDTPDKDLIEMKNRWTRKWESDSKKLFERQVDIEKYWKGDHPLDFLNSLDELDRRHPLIDNLIFESLETFLPQATRRNADPIVNADNSQEGEELADNVRKMLISLADTLHIRLKMKSAVRNWALYFLGVGKVAWDFEEDEIAVDMLRPQKLILDWHAQIDEGGKYKGEYLGERKIDTAANLIKRFPNKKDFITKFVHEKLGTEVRYVEWWADHGRILFWTLKDEVLDKARNPNWNYPEERTVTDEFGIESTESFTPRNHFNQPQFPYAFLTVFNLGLHPVDDTSLIEQNLGNQDMITKRYRQIDENVDGMNGGWAISGELSGIEKEQAAGAIDAFRDGRGVWIPQGSVNEAVGRITGNSLPSDVFNNLQDGRNELRGIFGVQGSTPQGIQREQTVRGKIIVAQQDQSRTGGGVTEYLEQFADRIYNLMVQMMYVYYDEPHVGSILGRANAMETVQLSNSELLEGVQLRVSVKEGSMIPKDPLTQANQAIDLATAGLISPLTLHERLDDPNPRETVRELVQFQINPLGVVGEGQGMVSPLQGASEAGSTELLSNVPMQ